MTNDHKQKLINMHVSVLLKNVRLNGLMICNGYNVKLTVCTFALHSLLCRDYYFQYATLEMCVWWGEDPPSVKAEWRCATTTLGGQCVVTHGI